ncbi:MAG: hypothetical protein R3F08_00410 [Dokdonella sp.]
MDDLWQRLRQRKLVQWAVAYLAGAWALLQVLDLVAASYAWPAVIMRVAFALIALGFVVTLILAWYHGERGEQKVTGIELMILAAVLAVGGGMLWRYGRGDAAGRPATEAAANGDVPARVAADIPFKSIAVLPFVNMSADPDQDYFSDGIAEELLNRLAQLPDLKVAARTSAFQFKGKNENIGDIARQLKVAHVLEGSVRKSGVTLRITAQLIDSRSGYHLWSDTYDRDASDIFKVQDEIAAAIAGELEAKLGGRPVEVKVANPAAHDAYLQGRDFLARRREAIDDAIAAFDRAIAIDPSYSDALSARAFATLLRPLWNLVPPSQDVLRQAQESAGRALQNDARNAEAYMVRGMAAWYLRDPAAAAADLDKALALAPGNVDILNLDGDFRTYSGDLAAAEREKRKAMALDPLSFVHPLNLSDILYFQGRHADAARAAEQAIGLGAKDYGYDRLVLSQIGTGKLEQARAALRERCAISGADSRACGFSEVAVLQAEGRHGDAIALLDRLARPSLDGEFAGTYDGPASVAWLYLVLDETGKATAAMRLALDADEWFMTLPLLASHGVARLPEEISTDPEWLAVWKDPRIKAVAEAYRRNLLTWRAGHPPPRVDREPGLDTGRTAP